METLKMKSWMTKTMFAAAAVMIAAGVASAQNLTAEIPFAFQAGGQTMAPGTYRVDYVGSQKVTLRLLNVDAGTSVVVLPRTLQDPPKDWVKRGVSGVAFACRDAGCELRELWING